MVMVAEALHQIGAERSEAISFKENQWVRNCCIIPHSSVLLAMTVKSSTEAKKNLILCEE
jgi:hypothetical protein